MASPLDPCWIDRFESLADEIQLSVCRHLHLELAKQMIQTGQRLFIGHVGGESKDRPWTFSIQWPKKGGERKQRAHIEPVEVVRGMLIDEVLFAGKTLIPASTSMLNQ